MTSVFCFCPHNLLCVEYLIQDIKYIIFVTIFFSVVRSFLRGQNVYVDPVTRKELEIKRKQYLEYQVWAIFLKWDF